VVRPPVEGLAPRSAMREARSARARSGGIESKRCFSTGGAQEEALYSGAQPALFARRVFCRRELFLSPWRCRAAFAPYAYAIDSISCRWGPSCYASAEVATLSVFCPSYIFQRTLPETMPAYDTFAPACAAHVF